MTLFLDDGDVRLYHGDALETVRQLPDDSVDCVVTSPPYWGLRDYGTGEWDGGDPDCDHIEALNAGANTRLGLAKAAENADGRPRSQESRRDNEPERYGRQYRTECGKCGARRVDRQMGLEPTPDQFVAGMVELFREIRRVLAAHGTCWVNLGDSYANPPASGTAGQWNGSSPLGKNNNAEATAAGSRSTGGTISGGLKQKDLCGIPWRVAFALQADDWWLRSDIIWAKPNPMPESVTDRPTKAHEYVFLLTKQPRYWFDTEAVREPPAESVLARAAYAVGGTKHVKERNDNGRAQERTYADYATGRNVRSVWQIATQPYPEAHFATYPEELARRCILAGCPIRVCRVCGKPSERIVERTPAAVMAPGSGYGDGAGRNDGGRSELVGASAVTLGWSDCACVMFGPETPEGDAGEILPQAAKWRPGVVLDPFIGSGTTAKVARDHQRHAIGIDLNPEYLELAARRLQQLSLLNAT